MRLVAAGHPLTSFLMRDEHPEEPTPMTQLTQPQKGGPLQAGNVATACHASKGSRRVLRPSARPTSHRRSWPERRGCRLGAQGRSAWQEGGGRR